ncbi:hypothetical protein [Nocardia sp. NBC_01009]|uniref:hypothetical protein n=1 Tax=Nocardia sp. NBC_01009 TaxID=2975996 RepID=UPI0038708F40|nr:hypothetical protein OHA42_20355 [Nocardia sp. NBC_01009]
MSSELLLALLLGEMARRTRRHPGHGLRPGVFVQNTPNGALITHNGGAVTRR